MVVNLCSIKLMDYSTCRQMSLSCGGFYIDCPQWLKNKNSTMKTKNNYNISFKNPVTAPLNHE